MPVAETIWRGGNEFSGTGSPSCSSDNYRLDVDAEVARMGDPVPPMFWLRDPTGHSLMVVEQA
jgi:hypothetical protein